MIQIVQRLCMCEVHKCKLVIANKALYQVTSCNLTLDVTNKILYFNQLLISNYINCNDYVDLALKYCQVVVVIIFTPRL